jgi:Ulp1 family protease
MAKKKDDSTQAQIAAIVASVKEVNASDTTAYQITAADLETLKALAKD